MKVKIGKYPEDGNKRRYIKVKLAPCDTWNMDCTLAHIIVPMLKQLSEIKHGAPYTDDDDVPEHLKSTSAKPKENEWDTDEFHFERWDWIMQEMIWGFSQIANNKPDEPKVFKYVGPMKTEEQTDGTFKVNSFGMTKIEGAEEQYEAYNKRLAKATLMFGKYYQHLWD